MQCPQQFLDALKDLGALAHAIAVIHFLSYADILYSSQITTGIWVPSLATTGVPEELVHQWGVFRKKGRPLSLSCPSLLVAQSKSKGTPVALYTACIGTMSINF